MKQQAVPQTPGPTNSSSPCQMNSVTMAVSTSSGSGSQRLSPLPGHKGIKKLTSFRNRSPTGQSPINKTRKPSQTMDNLVSPKTKTWKGRVAKQLRKMHGQTASPSSPTTQLPPEGATFKVPLELCPPVIVYIFIYIYFCNFISRQTVVYSKRLNNSFLFVATVVFLRICTIDRGNVYQYCRSEGS